MSDRLLKVADLAAIMGVTKRTIYNRVSRQPESLPPVTRVPAQKGLFWRESLVRQWLQAHTQDRRIVGVIHGDGGFVPFVVNPDQRWQGEPNESPERAFQQARMRSEDSGKPG